MKLRINISNVSLMYLYLPIFLFLLGWLNLIVAIPILILSAIGLYKVKKNITTDNYVSIKDIIFYFTIAFLFFIFCGHGGIMPQDGDWNKHHAILYDLMNYCWPVVYKENAMLTYYIGQYIVPAAIAKVFFPSEVAANWSLAIWNSIGLTIVFASLSNRFLIKKSSIKVQLVVFVLIWGGATNLGAYCYGWEKFSSFKWIDINFIRVHFASNFDALRGAFQHVLPAWISCCLLIDNERKVENYAAIALPLIFSATFGFVYFVFIVSILTLVEITRSKNKNQPIKRLFKFSNIAFLPLLGILIIYFAGNYLSDKPTQFGFGFLNLLQKENLKFFGSSGIGVEA